VAALADFSALLIIIMGISRHDGCFAAKLSNRDGTL